MRIIKNSKWNKSNNGGLKPTLQTGYASNLKNTVNTNTSASFVLKGGISNTPDQITTPWNTPFPTEQSFKAIGDNFNDIRNNLIDKSNPNLAKFAVDAGMLGRNVASGGLEKDAKELWKASSHDFKQSMNYINKNGKLVGSISELKMPTIENTVKTKMQTQMGVPDSKGIVFNDNSSLSKAIVKSPEFNSFINKNKSKLLQGRTISKDSLSFNSDPNLHNAIHNSDVLQTKINSKGELESIVFDTYDFNPNDPDWKVRVARRAQDGGVITTYYTLTKIRIPRNELPKYFKK